MFVISKILDFKNNKLKKKSSQNSKSRTPIRLSKFLTLLCTPTSTFNVTKNQVSTIHF